MQVTLTVAEREPGAEGEALEDAALFDVRLPKFALSVVSTAGLHSCRYSSAHS